MAFKFWIPVTALKHLWDRHQRSKRKARIQKAHPHLSAAEIERRLQILEKLRKV